MNSTPAISKARRTAKSLAVKRHMVDPRNRQRGPVFSASQVLIKD